MPGTVTVSRYAAAGNPRTNHSATAPTNERVSEATKNAEVAVSGTHLIADIAVICSERLLVTQSGLSRIVLSDNRCGDW